MRCWNVATSTGRPSHQAAGIVAETRLVGGWDEVAAWPVSRIADTGSAIWLYLRFTLSFGDVEDLLAERGLDVSYETVRRWVLKFGPTIARNLRQRRLRPSDR